MQRCLPQTIRRTLNELPETLDETYERVLKEIGTANRPLAHRLLQCITVAIRPLRLEELAEILALDFDGTEGSTPQLNEGWQSEDRQQEVLSTCSSLITVVGSGHSRVIQFSHFSVKEFLTSNRLSTSQGDNSRFYIREEPAHLTLARACLATLLHLDDNFGNSQVEDSTPMASYASRHWVEHAQFGDVSSLIGAGMRHLFDSTKPYFAAWLKLHDIDDAWNNFGSAEDTADRGSPLYYASLCGFHGLAKHIIIEYPEQVNSRGGLSHSPLVAALYKGHFKVAELLHQHGAVADIPGSSNRTPLQVASKDGLIDIVRWLLEHGADANSQNTHHVTPIYLAAANGHLEVVQTLLEHSVHVNTATDAGFTPLFAALHFGYTEIVRLLLPHGAVTGTNLNEDYNSQSLMPPSHVSLVPTRQPPAVNSVDVRELSPVRDAAANASQPILSGSCAATRADMRLPAFSTGGSATPATCALAQLPFTSLTPSHTSSPALFVMRSGEDGCGALKSASTWWSNPKRKRAIPIEQAEAYIHTRLVRPFLSTSFTDTHTL